MTVRGSCPVCGYRCRLRIDGRMQKHQLWCGSERLPSCRGSGMFPLAEGEGDPAAPRRIVVAGDWHGNAECASRVIRVAGSLLRDEPERVIVQLGDFGVWPGEGGRRYIAAVEEACALHGVQVWFVDGNHEDFTQVGRFDPWRSEFRHVMHLPRGWRWVWHGRTWLALGGGVSLDRAVRVEGRDWWPQEEITEAQAAAVSADGAAHVMVTHDCPAGVAHSFPAPPRFWDVRDLARNDAHRERLARVVSAVRPGWLLHGHLHRAYQRVCDVGFGPVEVTGLDCDGGGGPNWAVLDVKTMTWVEAQEGSADGARVVAHRGR